jgi:hypothetical protein
MKVIFRFGPTDSLTVLKVGKESNPSGFRWRLIDERFHDRVLI